MPHELNAPRGQWGKPSIHGGYIKTDVDEDDWDRAIMGFTAAQSQHDHRGFVSHYVVGGPELAKAIAEFVTENEEAILRKAGLAYMFERMDRP